MFRPPRQKSTISDVAKEAGVSTATVSFVVNKTKAVTPEVEARVKEAIDKLEYQPSRTAKSLRTGKSEILGLIIPDLTNPFFTRLAQDIEQEARLQGYATLLTDSHDNQQLQGQLITTLESRGVDGILLVPALHTGRAPLCKTPLVFLDRTAGTATPIQSNKYQGGQQAAQHLIELGHRHIAILAGPRRPYGLSERVSGMMDALAKANLAVALEAIEYGYYSVESGRQGTFNLIGRTAFTALIAANDTLALGALSALQSSGKNVPKEVSLIGFDDIPWASLSYPALTTICQDTRELARQALHAVFQYPDYLPKQIATQLVIRNSTAAPYLDGGSKEGKV